MLDVGSPLQPDEAHRRVRDAVRRTGLVDGTPAIVQDRGSGDPIATPDRRSCRARIQVKGETVEEAEHNYRVIEAAIEAVPGIGFSGMPVELPVPGIVISRTAHRDHFGPARDRSEATLG